jgi:hypothetical protein
MPLHLARLVWTLAYTGESSFSPAESATLRVSKWSARTGPMTRSLTRLACAFSKCSFRRGVGGSVAAGPVAEPT